MAARDDLVSAIQAARARYGLPPQAEAAMAAIADIESGWGKNVRGQMIGVEVPGAAEQRGQRAMGPFQFMPSTWAAYGRGGDPYNAYDAADATARMLQDSYKKHGDWLAAALGHHQGVAYNPGSVGPLGRDYLAKLSARMPRYLGGAAAGAGPDLGPAPTGVSPDNQFADLLGGAESRQASGGVSADNQFADLLDGGGDGPRAPNGVSADNQFADLLAPKAEEPATDAAPRFDWTAQTPPVVAPQVPLAPLNPLLAAPALQGSVQPLPVLPAADATLAQAPAPAAGAVVPAGALAPAAPAGVLPGGARITGEARPMPGPAAWGDRILEAMGSAVGMGPASGAAADRPGWFERMQGAAARAMPWEVNAAQWLMDQRRPVDPATGARLSAEDLRTERAQQQAVEAAREVPAQSLGEKAAEVVGGMAGVLRDPVAALLGPVGAGRAAATRIPLLAGTWGAYGAGESAVEQAARTGQVDPGEVAAAAATAAVAAPALDTVIRGAAMVLRRLSTGADGGGAAADAVRAKVREAAAREGADPDAAEAAMRQAAAGEEGNIITGAMNEQGPSSAGSEGVSGSTSGVVAGPSAGDAGTVSGASGGPLSGRPGSVDPGRLGADESILRTAVPGGGDSGAAAGGAVRSVGEGTVNRYERVRPADLNIDAARFQFRSNANAQGDTGRLAGVKQWDPEAAGAPLVWEDAQGQKWVADGHHRVNLAQRLEAEGQDIALDVRVLREADGVSAQDARRVAAIRNIQEGNSDPVDIARLFREATPEQLDVLLPRLPRVGNAAIRDGEALATLGPDAWDLVRAGQVAPNHAAEVARVLSDPAQQHAALAYLMRRPAQNTVQARLVAEQMRDAGFQGQADAAQGDLFGGSDLLDSLFLERAQVIDAAVRVLSQDRRVFNALGREAGRIEAAGNVLDRAGNQSRAEAAALLAERLRVQANQKGELSDAINAAAERVRAGARPDAEVRPVIDLLDAGRYSGADALDAAAAGAGGADRPAVGVDAGGTGAGGGRGPGVERRGRGLEAPTQGAGGSAGESPAAEGAVQAVKSGDLDVGAVIDLATERLPADDLYEVFSHLPDTVSTWRRGQVLAAIERVRVAGKRATNERTKQSLLADHGGSPVGLELRSDDGNRWAVIAPDPSEQGRFRAQYYDAGGFYSHATRDTPEQVLDELVAEGFRTKDAGALDRLSETQTWADGMARTAEIQRANQESWNRSQERKQQLRGTDDGLQERQGRTGAGEAADFNLKGQTPEEILAQERARKLQEEQARVQAERDAAPSSDEFVLTGSDRPADEAAARGQQSLFAAGGGQAPRRQAAAQAAGTGATSPPTGPGTGAGGAPVRAPRPDEILHALSRGLDVPVGYRRFWHRAAGVYNTLSGSIRLRSLNDLETLSHEVGHLLSARFPAIGRLQAAHAGELRPLASRGRRPLEEGWAEWMRLYLSQPGQAQARAPGFARDFEALLMQHPQERALLDRAATEIDAWFRQSPEDRLGSKIGHRPRGLEDLADTARAVPARAVFETLDRFNPIKQWTRELAGGRSLPVRDDPYLMTRLSAGSDGIIDHFIRAGTLPFDFDARAAGPAGPALADVLRPVRARAEEFQRYMVARRAEELHARRIETPFTDEEVQGTIRAYESPEFRAAFDGVLRFQDQVLQYAVDGGLVSHELADRMRAASQNYVPFRRVFEEADGGPTRARRSLADQTNPIRRIHGSALNVESPLQSILDNTAVLITATNRNYAVATLARLAGSRPGVGGRALERLPDGVQGQRVRVADIVRLFEDAGQTIDPQVAQALGDWAVFFRQRQRVDKQFRQVTVQMNGRPVTYEVNDGLLFESLSHMAPPETNSVEALLSGVGRTLRAGVVFDPSYMLRNLSRDQLTAWVQSRAGYLPVVDAARGMAAVALHSPEYWRFQAFGGGQSSFWAVQDKDAARLIGDVLDARPPGASRTFPVVQSARQAVRLLERLGEITESGSRLGEARKAEAQARAAGQSPGDAALTGTFAGREVSTDFAMRGASRSLYFLSRITPFLNAGIQGLYKGARSLGERGFRDSFVPVTVKAAAGVTLPSLALWYWTKDEPWYQDLPDSEKTAYWHLPPVEPGGAPIRIASPFEFGFLFGKVPVMAVEAWQSDLKDREGERFANAAMQTFGLRIAPPALLVPIELKTNYNFYQDRPIVPPFTTPGPYDYSPHTSEAAKAIAEAAGVSSLKVEHAVRGILGSLGTLGLMGADLAMRSIDGSLPRRPEMKATELPGVAAFFSRSPPTQSQPTQDLYDLLADVTGKIGAVRKLRQEGQDEAADQLVERMLKEGAPVEMGPGGGWRPSTDLRQWQQAQTQDRAMMRELAFDKLLAKGPKRAAMDELQRQVNDRSRETRGAVLEQMVRDRATGP